jgi:hypothetical protein
VVENSGKSACENGKKWAIAWKYGLFTGLLQLEMVFSKIESY